MYKATLAKIQKYVKNGPILDYLVVALALSLGASYMIMDGGTLATILAKVALTSVVLSMWMFMVYTFMQTPFHLPKCIFAAAITFVAQTNLVVALNMDKDGFAMGIEIVILSMFISCLIAAVMAEVKHIMDNHHNGKPKSS